MLGVTLALVLMLAPQAAAAGRCGSHPWCNTSLGPDARAELLLSALTQDEKIGLLGGDDLFGVAGGAHSHTGTDDGVPRVGLPTTYYSDGPLGPRQGSTTAMPAPMGLAATFDPEMAFRAGSVVANETRDKGNDVVFAPTVNIMRTPLNGRTFEAYGEDPYVDTQTTVRWIEGAQSQGVIADVKHFAANNQEGADPSGHTGVPGSPLGAGPFGSRYISNSVIDERTLREIYLPHFEAAVKRAGVGTVMCSYNMLNGQYACENHHLLQEILEREWGFKGYVLADYGAAHNTVASLNNGLDFEPWPGFAYSPQEIKLAVVGGQASGSTLDSHVRRMLRTLFAFGFFDRAAYRDDDAQIDKAAHARTAQGIEESAITLLRNRGALPLDSGRLKSIAIVGAPAEQFTTGGGSGAVTPFHYASPRQAIAQRAGPGVKTTYDDGSDTGQAVAHAKSASVAIVFAADYQTEGADKQCLTLECPDSHGDQDALIQSVAAANPNTIVVLETGGPVLTPWRDSVKALVEAWYPGQQAGPALARVLFGDADPGGRLPATFPRQEGDIPTAGDPEKYPGFGEDVKYKEGVLVGYRWYDAKRIAPAFPFGFGLSYSTFSLHGLGVQAAPGGGVGASVSVDVTNTGHRAGVAVPQLYLGMPQPAPGVVQPPKQLRGYRKLSLAPGRTKRVTFAIDSRALSYWDVHTNGWRVAPGCYGVMVGSSSRDIAQRATIAVGGASCAGAATAIPAKRPSCRPPGSISIRIRGVRPSRVRRVTVYVNGHRRAVLLGRRSKVPVSLRGLKGRVRIRLVVRTRKHFTLVQQRTVQVCRAA